MFSPKYKHFYLVSFLLIISLILIALLVPLLSAPKPNPKDHATLQAYQRQLEKLQATPILKGFVEAEEKRVSGILERVYADCLIGVATLKETIKTYSDFYERAIQDLTSIVTTKKNGMGFLEGLQFFQKMKKSLQLLVLVLGLLMAVFCQDPSDTTAPPSTSEDIQENTNQSGKPPAGLGNIESIPYTNEELRAMTPEKRREVIKQFVKKHVDRVSAQETADRAAFAKYGGVNPNKIYLSKDPKKSNL